MAFTGLILILGHSLQTQEIIDRVAENLGLENIKKFDENNINYTNGKNYLWETNQKKYSNEVLRLLHGLRHRKISMLIVSSDFHRSIKQIAKIVVAFKQREVVLESDGKRTTFKNTAEFIEFLNTDSINSAAF